MLLGEEGQAAAQASVARCTPKTVRGGGWSMLIPTLVGVQVNEQVLWVERRESKQR